MGPAEVTPSGRNNKQCKDPAQHNNSPSGAISLYSSNYLPMYGYMS